MSQANLKINRRQFLVTGVTVSGGLMFGLPVLSSAAEYESAKNKIGFFIEIKADNTVVIGSNQPEIGQGVR
ncbi:MAG: hypothetical protein ACSHWU_09930, partial [Marinicella sp.]